MAPRLIDVVLQFAMHAQKVFLDMIGTIELLEASVALKGFLILVYVLVPCVQIPAIRRVGTVGARIALHYVHSIGSCSCGGCLCLGGLLATAAAAPRGAAAATAAAAVGGR